MKVLARCGQIMVSLEVPDTAVVYEPHFEEPVGDTAGMVLAAVRNPMGKGPALRESLASRRSGEVVVVVSDITRPIPYADFIGELLEEIESAGVSREEIILLVATGMHRPSTPDERTAMFGDVAERYRIVDHCAEDEAGLAVVPGKSWSGSTVRLNRRFVEAGFRLVTGLVEPHFMAGFSGGRKAVCPGLASLDTVRRFHGAEFLSDPQAANANLDRNPLHLESLSIARLVGIDFSLNVVIGQNRRVMRAFAGGMEEAHGAACEFVRARTCPHVDRPADIVVTSCGGYPLDATFYQCVKGIVSCLPAVRAGGAILAFASCSEGIGSSEYTELMRRYAGQWQRFLYDIQQGHLFVKDQWQYQMHCRALEKVGEDRIVFVTDGLEAKELARLSVRAAAASPGRIQEVLQGELDRLLNEYGREALVAIVPEGPYCAPV